MNIKRVIIKAIKAGLVSAMLGSIIHILKTVF
jgi:hypothetical protein